MTYININNDLEGNTAIDAVIKNCQQQIEELAKCEVCVFVRRKHPYLSTDDLMAIVCSVCEVTPSQIISKEKTIQIVTARQLFCWFAITVQKRTLINIAAILRRDHTTVIHSREKISIMMKVKDGMVTPLFLEIEKRINDLVTKPALS